MRCTLMTASLCLLLAAPLAAAHKAKPKAPIPTATLSPTAAPTPVPAWPTFKGDEARSGRGPELLLPVHEAWRVSLKGSSYSSPVAKDGLVVLGSSAKRLYGIDLASGAVRWMGMLPDRVWGASPAIAGASAYIGCLDGCLHAFSLADGSAQGSFCSPQGDDGSIFSAVLVAGGKVIFGSDDKSIYAWTPGQAKADWTVATGAKLHDNGGASADGTVYFPSRDGKLYALSLADGALRWTFETHPKDKDLPGMNTVPAVQGGFVYLGAADDKLHALKASDGSEAWSFATQGAIMSSPALAKAGVIVFGCADKYVYCLSTADGSLRWKFKTGDVVVASPLITGDLVWIGSYDKQFYCLDLKTGDKLFSTRIGGGIYTSAAAIDGRILVTGRSGDLVCLMATEPSAFAHQAGQPQEALPLTLPPSQPLAAAPPQGGSARH